MVSAVPLQASNLALPCREMCESVVSTCSCNKERKFGDLLEKVDAAVSSGSSGLVCHFFLPFHSPPKLYGMHFSLGPGRDHQV